MPLEIVRLAEDHLADAAALFCARYAELRAEVAELPARYDQVSTIRPLLAGLVDRVPGVAALQGGRLAGYLLGIYLPQWRGKRAVFCPEWANAGSPGAAGGSGDVYRAMYAVLSREWVDQGCSTHLVSLLAHDRPGIAAWHWSGFGLCAVDAVRDLAPIEGGGVPHTPVRVRRAGVEDAQQAWELDQALHRYMADPPTLLFDDEEEGPDDVRQWLADPGNTMWLAEQDGQAVAFMLFGPANEDASTIIADEGTASITGAFTRGSIRGGGIGKALLNEGLAWARQAGYRRCAVDWEPENVEGSRFWLKHFKPVVYSLARYVDERFVA